MVISLTDANVYYILDRPKVMIYTRQ